MPPSASATQQIRVLAVDDHPLLRDGISAALMGEPDLLLVGEASDGRGAIEAFRRHRPDVTLMDLVLPDMSGIEAIATLRQDHPGARFIVLTTYKGDAQALAALKAGAAGYLLKSMLRADLVNTIRLVHAGGRYVPEEIAMQMVEHAMQEPLSARELDVLAQIAAGKANRQAAMQLGIAEETVKSHVKRILAKLGATDRTHALVIARKRGIVLD